MKFCILIFLFSIISLTYADDSYSPEFKCINQQDDSVKYILISSEQKQEREIKIVSSEEYYNNELEVRNNTYILKVMTEEGFLTKDLEVEIEDNFIGHKSLHMNESNFLKVTLEKPLESNCGSLEQGQCTIITEFQCEKQDFVDALN